MPIHLVIRVLGSALLLGILGDWLIRVDAWGLTGLRTAIGPLNFASTEVPWGEITRAASCWRSVSVVAGRGVRLPRERGGLRLTVQTAGKEQPGGL